MPRRTRPRTVASTPYRQSVRGRQEGLPAVETRGFYGAFAYASPHHEAFVVADLGATASPASEQVASYACRDEVGWGVVSSVAIQMVRDDRTTSAPTLDPLQLPSAPMAFLQAEPYRIHEYKTVLLDGSITASEGMIRTVEMPVSVHLNSITAEGVRMNPPKEAKAPDTAAEVLNPVPPE